MKQVELVLEQGGYFISEAYKSLRTNIQFCGNDKKVIAVTSSAPSEGKSSVSMQLAVALAESGKRTVLVDADLRKSVLLGRVKTNGQKINGLTHVLSGQEVLKEVVCSTDVKNCHVIFSGPLPPNPAELLGGVNFEKIINALRNVYDYVIVDLPPVGSVIDAAVAAEYCDGIIMVIKAGVISYRFAQEAKAQLDKTNCPILGVVLNQVDTQRQAYGKYGKYAKYGEYAHNDK